MRIFLKLIDHLSYYPLLQFFLSNYSACFISLFQQLRVYESIIGFNYLLCVFF